MPIIAFLHEKATLTMSKSTLPLPLTPRFHTLYIDAFTASQSTSTTSVKWHRKWEGGECERVALAEVRLWQCRVGQDGGDDNT